MEIELNPRDSELDVSVSIGRISEEFGTQGILGDGVPREDADHFYLAAIALETMDDEQYDINDALMEYIRNSSGFEHVTDEAANRIEDLLK